MEMTKAAKCCYFNEFYFHQLVLKVNRGREARGEEPISLREARILRGNMDLRLVEGSRNFATVGFAGMANAANTVLRDANGGRDIVDMSDGAAARDEYNRMARQFGRDAGFSEPGPNGRLAISPLDPRFVGRTRSLDVAYAEGADVARFGSPTDRRVVLSTFSDDMSLEPIEPVESIESGPEPEVAAPVGTVQGAEAPAPVVQRAESSAPSARNIGLSNEQRLRFFNEFAFHQVVAGINARRTMAGSPLLRVSQSRDLRAAFGRALSGQGSSMDTAGSRRFISVANEVFAEANGGPVFTGTDAEAREAYDSMVSDFMGHISSEAPVVPMSPFDPRFSANATFRKNGSTLLFANGEDVVRYGPAFDERFNLGRLNDNGRMVSAGPCVSPDDRSGMSALMPFIAQKDYRKVADWVNKVGEDDPSRYVSAAGLERSQAILRDLQETGTPYSVECDQRVGQLKVKLTGTKISVRLLDPDESYIGRVYDDGLQVYYTTTQRQPGSKTRKTVPYENPRTEDVLRLLHFVQGKSVTKLDSEESLGTARTYSPFRNGAQLQESYHSGLNFTAVAGSVPGNPNERVSLHVKSNRSPATVMFADEDAANSYLKNAVESAAVNFRAAIDVDMLVREAREHGNEDGYKPAFSGDGGIAAIQQSYWEVLTGHSKELLKPGFDVDEYDMRMDALGARDLHGTALESRLMSDMVYSGMPEEKVRQHLDDNTARLVGSFEPDAEGKRFDPVTVASYMQSEFGRYRNNDNIIAALRTANIDADELKGNDFYNKAVRDKLIKFDPATARPMRDINNKFVASMYDEIQRTIRESGCILEDGDVLMDDNGIVHYTATKVTKREPKFEGDGMTRFEGEIGQIFVPDEKGLVETKFAGSDNYLFSPGYEAYIVPQREGENKSMEQRTRLRGYEQIMRESIRYRLRSDVLSNKGDAGSPVSINNAYRRLYDTRYPLNLMQMARQDGMSDDLLDDILATNARRVRYGNEMKDGSTVAAEYMNRDSSNNNDPTNDNYMDPFTLSGHRNMSIMSEQGDGYFDASATGTSTNQGITRYLVEGAEVTPDGEIIPGDPDDKTPLMKNKVCKYMDYVPFDRRQMTFNNLMKASCVAEGIHTAQMTFGGWTFDDGYVVSKDFAETYKIRGSGGEMRSLMKGDKISDMNGNKGVISLVVDPDMDLEEAERQGIREPVAWFKANKGHLDVVGAPFPAPSRFNGGSARELMENPSDLTGPDGKVYEGCVGRANYIITHMPVDEKTHVYGEDELAQGKGRKASAQLAWAFASHGAVEVLNECYGSNNGSLSNLREMLITMGLDMDETGTFRDRYEPHEGEKRNVFPMQDLIYRESAARGHEGEQVLDVTEMRRQFSNVIAQTGGVLEMPFALECPTGNQTPRLNAEKTDVTYDGAQAGDTYGLPVLSSHLRSGQEFIDGTSHVHDYTNSYLRIYEAACRYRDAQSKNDREAMSGYQRDAQAEYNKITFDMVNRRFEGKHNVFRDTIMANRLPHSATAVWTADPRLDVDEVAIGPGLKDALGVEKDGDYIAIWRDPVLRDAGVRYMRAKVDDTLVGAAINPAMDKGFDGDFDGDSVGLAALQSKAAKAEALEKLTVGANLLDYGVKNSDGTYDLMLQNSLDLKSAAYARPEVKQGRADLTAKVNKLESMIRDGRMTDKEEIATQRGRAVRALSDHIKDAFAHEYGTDMICFKDMKSHMHSVEHMVVDGAKGSYSKLEDYAKYLGVSYERVPASVDEKEPINLDSIVDLGRPTATRDDDLGVEYATAVKSFGTGVAGMFSQRAITVLRNVCPKAALELTYPATQSVLQSKHDPVDAKRRYDQLMQSVRHLWRGEKLEKDVRPDGSSIWSPVKDENGVPVQASPSDFKAQFMDIYSSKSGMGIDINPDYVGDIARILTNPKTGMMMNIETEGRERFAAPMDRLAYGGKMQDVFDMAKNKENLFSGEFNEHFMPSIVRKNRNKAMNGGEMQAIQKDDTSVGYVPRKQKSDVVVVKVKGTLEKDVRADEKALEKMRAGELPNGEEEDS